MVSAICKELELQRSFLGSQSISSIYFGGGTPSLLTALEVETILSTIHEIFKVQPDAEITLEANPDDISRVKITDLSGIGVNRVSLGIQTFDERVLKFLNRSHNARQARQAFDILREAGIDNISADLIYGIPDSERCILIDDLAALVAENLPHISTYCLTIEPDTVFGTQNRKGILHEKSEDTQAEEYELISSTLISAGYLHYEISNFGQPSRLAEHNTSYWQNTHYLGIGPGAHSYNGSLRSANVRSNPKYIRKIAEGQVPAIAEELTFEDKVNESILTGLRTMWGIDLERIEGELGYPLTTEKEKEIAQMRSLGYLETDKLTLTGPGRLLADELASKLFL